MKDLKSELDLEEMENIVYSPEFEEEFNGN